MTTMLALDVATKCLRGPRANGDFHDVVALDRGAWLLLLGTSHNDASGAARDVVTRAVREHVMAGAHLQQALLAADHRLRMELCADLGGLEKGSEEEFFAGWCAPGSVVVAAIIGKAEVQVAWVGDCRAYLLRENAIVGVTRDHSLLEEYMEHRPLTREERRAFPHKRVVTRFLGGRAPSCVDEAECSLETWSATAGDTLLLCSSGVGLELDEHEILELVVKPNPSEGIVNLAATRTEVGATAMIAKVLRSETR